MLVTPERALHDQVDVPGGPPSATLFFSFFVGAGGGGGGGDLGVASLGVKGFRGSGLGVPGLGLWSRGRRVVTG